MAQISRWRPTDPTSAELRRRAAGSGSLLALLVVASLGFCSVAAASTNASGRGASPAARTGTASPVTRLRGQIAPALLRLARSRGMRPADRRRQLTITITLRRRRQAAFDAFLEAVDEPGSPRYHHYLSEAALTRRFGPTRAEYDAVARWLHAAGLRLVAGSADRLTITVAGTVGEVQRAFAIGIGELRVGDRSVYAPTREPAVPRALARYVQSVAGLSNLARPEGPSASARARTGGESAAFAAPFGFDPLAASSTLGAGPRPLTVQVFEKLCIGGVISGVTFTLSGWLKVLVAAFQKGFASLLAAPGFVFGSFFCASLGGVIGAQYVGCLSEAHGVGAAAWETPECEQFKGFPEFGRNFGHPRRHSTARRSQAGASPLASGAAAPAAAKIGLLEYDTFRPSDVSDWLEATESSASMSALSEVPVNGGVSAPGAGESEVLLDIDTVMYFNPLPGTRYVVYDAPPSTSFQTMFNTMIGDGDTVISNSWSQCENQTSEAEAASIDSVLAQAEASGITVVNGTGDGGSTCLDGSPNTIGVPSDSPHAIAVGGSTIDEPKSELESLSYPGERWWNGAGEMPPTGAGGFGVSRYFRRPAYQERETEASMRSVPDVVMPANPRDGVLLCQVDAGGCPGTERFGGTSFAAPLFAALASLGHGLTVSSLYSLGEAPGVFHDAESMGSDFAHVGLGSIDLSNLLAAAEQGTPSPVSAAHSIAVASGTSQASATATTLEAAESVPADGRSEGIVHVQLLDEQGFPVAGKRIKLIAAPGSKVEVTGANATTDADGGASFTVSDRSVEEVTFTVEDETDGVTLDAHPELRFVAPVATGAQIDAGPSAVPVNSGEATVHVYLQNALGRPAAGKTVMLAQSGSGTIAGEGSGASEDTALTDAAGEASFAVSDSSEETDVFTAVDTSDELPVPGSAQVIFYAGEAPTCANEATPAGGYSLSTFASPFVADPYEQVLPGNFHIGACTGVEAPAFDSSGDAFVANNFSGSINVFGAAGGTPEQANELPEASFGRDDITGLVFGREGELYATLSLPPPEGVNDNADPEIVQLDPRTGAIVRVVATHADGVPYCPNHPTIDPLTGDLFVSGGCTGYLYSGEIARVSNPSSPEPKVSEYASASGIGNGVPYELAFAQDGELYAAVAGTELVKVAATSSPEPEPHRVSEVLQYIEPNTDFGVGLAITASEGGEASRLLASGLGGNLYSIDLAGTPTASKVAQRGASSGSFGYEQVGPDGCVYVSATIAVDRFGEGPSCGSSGNVSSSPSLGLSASGPSPAPSGSAVTFTATLANFPAPAGRSVHFIVEGANSGVGLVHANAAGEAAFTYSGVFVGRDHVRAYTEGPGGTVESASLEQRWDAGRDTTTLSLNESQGEGLIGAPATLTANLADVSVEPATPLANESVTLTLAGQSCTARTDSEGDASCEVTPGAAGLEVVSASFAGSEAYTPASASVLFEAGPIGEGSAPQGGGPAAPPGGGSAPPGAGPPAGVSPVQCTTSGVELLDVYPRHDRVHVLGRASPSLAGRKAKIRSVWNHRVVAKAKISRSGYFKASVKLPPRKLRHGGRARYAASVGSRRSRPVKLVRRLYVFRVSIARHASVRIVGEVVRPLARPPAKIVVKLRERCDTPLTRVKAKVKLNRRSGKFTISTHEPSHRSAQAVYELSTRVRRRAHSRGTIRVSSLPRGVGD